MLVLMLTPTLKCQDENVVIEKDGNLEVLKMGCRNQSSSIDYIVL